MHNAFDDALIADLTQKLQMLEADQGVRVVVLAGKGKSFSAGADLNWMQRMALYSEAENKRDAEALATLMRTLDTLKKPTIALVQGSAFGGGCGLVACCDIALAAETASFAITEVRLGLIPAVISPYVVAAIGARWARRYFLTAESFERQGGGAAGAGARGTFKPDQLDFAVDQLCDTLVANGPAAHGRGQGIDRGWSPAPMSTMTLADEDTARRIAAPARIAGGEGGHRALSSKSASRAGAA